MAQILLKREEGSLILAKCLADSSDWLSCDPSTDPSSLCIRQIIAMS